MATKTNCNTSIPVEMINDAYDETKKTIITDSKGVKRDTYRDIDVQKELNKTTTTKFYLNRVKDNFLDVFAAENADIKHKLENIYNPEKVSGYIQNISSEINAAYHSAYGMPATIEVLRNAHVFRRALWQLKNGAPLSEVAGYQKLVVEKGMDVNDFHRHIEDGYIQSINDLQSDKLAVTVMANVNNVKRKYLDEFNKVAGDAAYDLAEYGEYGVEGLYEHLGSILLAQSKNKQFADKIQRQTGIKLEQIVRDPKLLDTVICSQLELGKRWYEFINYMREDRGGQGPIDVSDKFLGMLSENADSRNKLTIDYILNLDANDILRTNIEKALEKVPSLKEMVDENKQITLTEIKQQIDKMISETAITTTEQLYEDPNGLAYDYINENKESTSKQLYELVNGRQPSLSELTKQYKTMIKVLGKSRVNNPNERQIDMLETLKDSIVVATKEHAGTENRGVLQKIAEQFPGYVVISMDGTKIADKNGEPIKIEELGKDFVPGSYMGAFMSNKIVNDQMQQMFGEMFGEEYVEERMQREGFMVVPESVAKTIFEAKKPALSDYFKSSTIYKISSSFRKFAILSPFSFGRYAVTQYMGNIYWTLISNPNAFKYWKTAMSYAKAWNDKSFYTKKMDETDYGKIFIKLVEHNGGYANFTETEMGTMQLEGLEYEQELTPKNVGKLVMQKSTNASRTRENIHRFALAISHFEDIKSGNFNEASLIGANQKRINSIGDVYEKVATLAHEQMIDYNDISAFGKRANATIMMFWTYTEGMIKNHYRMFTGTYKTLKTALQTGDTRLRNDTLKKAGMMVFVMGGLLSMVWNTVMNGMGLLSDEDYERMKEENNNSGMAKLSNYVGLPGDGFIYLPGTGINGFDSMFGIGENKNGDPIANKKFNASDGLIEWIPGLSGENFVQTYMGNIVSAMNPVYRAPIEYMTGTHYTPWGVYTDPDWAGRPEWEKVVETVSQFYGAGSFTKTMFENLHGDNHGPMSDDARNVQDIMSRVYEVNDEGRDTEQTQYEYEIRQGIQRMDPDMTMNAMAEYITHLQNWNAQHPEDQVDIQSRLNSLVRRSTIIGNLTPETYEAMTSTDPELSQRMNNALQAQLDFLATIGIDPSIILN